MSIVEVNDYETPKSAKNFCCHVVFIVSNEINKMTKV